MNRTLRRLARIQRIRRDEARHALSSAEEARVVHGEKLTRCHTELQNVRAASVSVADELMRKHVYSLRQEMLRRKLQARAEELDEHVRARRDELVTEVRRVNTTERFAESLEAMESLERARKSQGELDEVGMMTWLRRARGAA